MSSGAYIACFLYVLPGIYGILMLAAGIMCLYSNVMFSVLSISFGLLYLVTCIVGEIGICLKHEGAVRSTTVLVILENIIAFVLAIFLLTDMLWHSSEQTGAALWQPTYLNYPANKKITHISGKYQQIHVHQHSEPVGVKQFLGAQYENHNHQNNLSTSAVPTSHKMESFFKTQNRLYRRFQDQTFNDQEYPSLFHFHMEPQSLIQSAKEESFLYKTLYTHTAIAYCIATFVLLGAIFTACSISYLTDFLSNLDADIFIAESMSLQAAHDRTPLLHDSSTPSRLHYPTPSFIKEGYFTTTSSPGASVALPTRLTQRAERTRAYQQSSRQLSEPSIQKTEQNESEK